MTFRYFPILLVLSVSFCVAVRTDGQPINPQYLSEFPSVERVKAEIKGTSAMDTAARQMGAFWQLRKIIEQMSGFRVHRNQLTPAEGKLIGLYSHGYQQAEAPYANHPDRAGWSKMYNTYLYSDEFRDEIFAKLLTPQIKAQWAQTEGNTKAAVAASREARARSEGRPQNNAPVVNLSVPAPQTRQAVSVGAADPSIAKAEAAKVDTRVLGMQLGEPLGLPECSILQIAVTQNCISPAGDLAHELAGLLGTKSKMPPNMKILKLADDYCPSWVVETCDAYATIHEGRLAAVAVYTKGRNVEKSTGAELRDKYGPPTRVNRATISPDVGNAFSVSNLEWVLPGLHVEYEVVFELEDEGRVRVSEGIVRIETDSAYQRRIGEKKAPPKRKL